MVRTKVVSADRDSDLWRVVTQDIDTGAQTTHRARAHGHADQLALPRELVMANATEVRKAIISHIGGGRRHLVLDLSDTDFVDSSGLSVLVAVLKAVRKVGGEVVLLNLSEGVRTLIELTRMNEVFDIYADRDAAVDRVCGRRAA